MSKLAGKVPSAQNGSLARSPAPWPCESSGMTTQSVCIREINMRRRRSALYLAILLLGGGEMTYNLQ